MPAVEIGFPATSAASDVSQSFTTLENPISQTTEAARAGPNSAIAKVAIGAHHPLGVSGIVEPASTAVTMVSAAASGGNVGISSNAGSGASFGGVTGRRSGERGKGQRQYAHETCTGPAPTKLLASKHQVQHCQEQLQKQQQLALAADPATEAATLVVHSIQTTSPPIRGVTQAQVNQPYIDLASRRRLKVGTGSRLTNIVLFRGRKIFLVASLCKHTCLSFWQSTSLLLPPIATRTVMVTPTRNVPSYNSTATSIGRVKC